MGELDERLRRLEMELEALQRIKTQEDFDDGARLHALHNAPWVKGQYSHLEFKPYVHQAFPMAIYGVGYLEARRAYEEAEMIPAFGMNDVERKQAIMLAERALDRCVKKVGSEGELRQYLKTGEWFESPAELVARADGLQRDIEQAAAHRAYEDRNMGEGAKRELEAYDDAADHFVTHIPERPKAPKARRVTTDTAIKAAAAAGGQHGKGKGSSADEGKAGGAGRKR